MPKYTHMKSVVLNLFIVCVTLLKKLEYYKLTIKLAESRATIDRAAQHICTNVT